jgi:hypothetical protein
MLTKDLLRTRMLGLKKQFLEFGKDEMLLVEGPTDKNLVEKCKMKRNWQVFPVQGKQGVIDGCTPLFETDKTIIHGLIDQDYDWITNDMDLNPSILKIDENNIEMMLFENIFKEDFCSLKPESIEFIVNCAKEIGVLRATCDINRIKANFNPLEYENNWFAAKPFNDNYKRKDLTKFKKDMYTSFKEYGKNKRNIGLGRVIKQPYDGVMKNHLIINGKDLLLLIALAETNESVNVNFRKLLQQISNRLTRIATQNINIIRKSSLGKNLAILGIWDEI